MQGRESDEKIFDLFIYSILIMMMPSVYLTLIGWLKGFCCIMIDAKRVDDSREMAGIYRLLRTQHLHVTQIYLHFVQRNTFFGFARQRWIMHFYNSTCISLQQYMYFDLIWFPVWCSFLQASSKNYAALFLILFNETSDWFEHKSLLCGFVL